MVSPLKTYLSLEINDKGGLAKEGKLIVIRGKKI